MSPFTSSNSTTASSYYYARGWDGDPYEGSTDRAKERLKARLKMEKERRAEQERREKELKERKTPKLFDPTELDIDNIEKILP